MPSRLTLLITVALVAVSCSRAAGESDQADPGSDTVRSTSTTVVETTTSTTSTTGPTTTTVPPTPLIDGVEWEHPGTPIEGSIFERIEGSEAWSVWGIDGPVVALSFDDGPSSFTPYVLDVLQITGVPATFFVVGDIAERRPEWVRELVARGHRVGAHSRSHPHLEGAPLLRQMHEIAGGADQVDAALGTPTVRCYRPPYREFDDVSRQVAADRGLATALWSVDSADWDGASTDEIVRRVITTVRDGSVILLHDGGGDRLRTLAALPWIIRALQQLGFTFVPFC